MRIDVAWSRPLPLRDGSAELLTYTCDELDPSFDEPGVYVFARRHGQRVSPLYIGQASRLKQRVEQQFANNARLMNGLKQAEAGQRILLLGRVQFKRGQQLKQVLNVLESALIEHSLAQGHELLNKRGAKTPVHTISFQGNRASRCIAPLHMNVRKR
jgi:hypothetical protein